MAAPSNPAKPTSILDALARDAVGEVAAPEVRDAPVPPGDAELTGLGVVPAEVVVVTTGGSPVVEPVVAGRLAVEGDWPIQAVTVEFWIVTGAV